MGPVAEFCAALRQLRLASGADPVVLARQVGLSRTQLYAVLAGEIKRPPDWDQVVGPLVAACTGGDPAALAWWRRRHAVLVEVAEEIRRRDRAARPGGLQAPAAPGPAGPPEIRHSLPPDTAAFTGRDAEVAQVIAAATGAGGMVTIRGIGGMGKTALAVHAAHLLTGRFPDRQLFIDLHAHTPGQDPVLPEAALAGLLATVGVDPGHLPEDLPGRAGLWRDKMAGQRAVLVLDNAASSAQVVPLLPGDAGCLVLVTSRRYLGDLPGPVIGVLLDALSPEQAQAMFVQLAPRAVAEPAAAVQELVQLAGYLPLAVCLLARVHARHPSWTLADLTAETRASPLTLAAENHSVTAAFDVSYRYLDPARQQFFRRLGLHPGATTDAYAAAALAAVSVHEAAGLLDGLYGEGLLTETGYRRFGMHDLIRRYARDLAAADPDADRGHALERLLDYYQHAAAIAEALLALQSRTRPAPADCVPAPAAIPGLPDRARALTWTRVERANLLACLDHVTRTGQDARVVTLTAGIAALLRHDGPWSGAAARHATAVQAARRLGDRQGHADALSDLGIVRRLTGDSRDATAALEAALGIYRDLGDRLGEANALTELGVVWLRIGDSRDAAQALEMALGIFRGLGDRLGEANALHDLGGTRMQTGDYRDAAQAQEAALGIYRDLGDRGGVGSALTELAAVRILTGDYLGAAQALEAALSIFRDLGDRGNEGYTLGHLAAMQRLTGDYQSAAETQEAALGIYGDLGDRLGHGNALGELGAVRILTGDYPGAAEALEAALGISRDLGSRGCEVKALNEMGTLHRVRNDLDHAVTCHRQALDLAREIGAPWDEAHALAGLGRCALAGGRADDARADLRQAQEIFQRTGAAEAISVAAELDAVTGTGPPAQR